MANKLELFYLQQAIRNYFNKEGFLDVLTPPIVENPGMEVHIHPFSITSVYEKKEHNLYLHTSPEFHMKELLKEGLEKIFTMSYCFRDEPDSSTHRKQFIMLEWYRAHSNYNTIMEDVIELFKYCHSYLKDQSIEILPITDFKRMTVDEAFREFLNIEILNLIDKDKLFDVIAKRFKKINLSDNRDDYAWDDLFFLLMYNYIEPEIKKYPFLLLYEFPYPLRALSTIKKEDPRVCERFEVYCHGIEICNCFNELTNPTEQKTRFEDDQILKKKLYHYNLPWPKRFMNTIEAGIPKSAGIALGVERLLMALTAKEDVFFD